MSCNFSIRAKGFKRKRNILKKELRALVDCAKSMHRRKIPKVTALSEKVNIKSYKETSAGIMRIPTYSLPLEHYFAAIIEGLDAKTW